MNFTVCERIEPIFLASIDSTLDPKERIRAGLDVPTGLWYLFKENRSLIPNSGLPAKLGYGWSQRSIWFSPSCTGFWDLCMGFLGLAHLGSSLSRFTLEDLLGFRTFGVGESFGFGVFGFIGG